METFNKNRTFCERFVNIEQNYILFGVRFLFHQLPKPFRSLFFNKLLLRGNASANPRSRRFWLPSPQPVYARHSISRKKSIRSPGVLTCRSKSAVIVGPVIAQGTGGTAEGCTRLGGARKRQAPLTWYGLRAFIHVTDRKTGDVMPTFGGVTGRVYSQGLARVGPTAAAVVFLHGFGEHSSPVPPARERTERHRHRLWARQDRLRAHRGRPPASAEHRSSSPTRPVPLRHRPRPARRIRSRPLRSNPAATGGWSQPRSLRQTGAIQSRPTAYAAWSASTLASRTLPPT